ncbi:MAG: ubiquinone/menaquinone biosynthesis methyltransferase [Acidobacteria bacterium]|nr:ubiquinone/menaquinone biosynthesis methyltransferase [Acidobacteriota bacterium]
MKRAGSPAPGTQPPGSTDEAAAARYVRKLFSDVSPRYDRLNHLLSLHVDRYWRRATARQFRHWLRRPEARVLDLCCGTADLTLALAREGPAQILSCDFAHPMLLRAQKKLQQRSLFPLVLEADALRLPFADSSFDLVACSFGFRNLANYSSGLREIWRVLRPGGEVGILEFSQPDGRWLGPLYAFYFHRILPAIGEWVSGVPGSYSYLPSSVERFPDRQDFLEWMRKAGFRSATLRPLNWGIAVLYSGAKPALMEP